MDYHRFLRAFGERSIAERPPVVGLSKQFAPFYEMMFRNRRLAHHTGFLRDEFVSFGLHHWGRAAVDKKLLRGRSNPAEQRFISKAEFARRFGIWAPTMKRMIAAGSAVTTMIRSGKSSRTVIDLHLSRSPLESAGVVEVRDAADYLGLPVSVLRELREAGVFATKQRLGREASWHKDDVEEFLKRTLALASALAEGIGVLRLTDVMRRKLRDATAKADIVAALFDGRLAVVGRVGENFSGLQLDRAQLDELVLSKRIEVEANTYSLPEAATRTGLCENAIKSAIELSLLEPTDRDGRTRITAASIDAFNESYIPVAVLAKRFGTLARVLVRMCSENDIALTTLRRTNNPAAQCILPNSAADKLINLWEERTAPRVRRGKADNTKVYEAFLTKYLIHLRATGGKLPRRGGKLNHVAIAKACGFRRHVIVSFPSVAVILADFEERERIQAGTPLDPVAALQKYLKGLRDTGALLPRSKGGRPNKVAVARECQFDRNVFYGSPKALALLQEYDAWEAERAVRPDKAGSAFVLLGRVN